MFRQITIVCFFLQLKINKGESLYIPLGAHQNVEGEEANQPNIVMQSVVLGRKGSIRETDHSVEHHLRKLVQDLFPSRFKRQNLIDNSKEPISEQFHDVLEAIKHRRNKLNDEDGWARSKRKIMDRKRRNIGMNENKKKSEEEILQALEEYLKKKLEEEQESKKRRTEQRKHKEQRWEYDPYKKLVEEWNVNRGNSETNRESWLPKDSGFHPEQDLARHFIAPYM